ncbi:MAG: collagen binding domain-containing protein [Collinsella sp.]
MSPPFQERAEAGHAPPLTPHLCALPNDFSENPISFDIEIAKTKGGEDDSWESDDGQGNAATGVQFQIISNTTNEVVGTLTTNDAGFASTKDAATCDETSVSEAKTDDPARPWFGSGKRNAGISGAVPYDAAGYTIREVDSTVPEGFDHVDDWTISADDLVDGTTKYYSVIDKTLNSRIQIVKTDAETGNTVPLSGFKFQVLDSNGETMSFADPYDVNGTVDTFTTDDAGQVTIPQRLKSGKYSIKEVSAAAPYTVNGDAVGFEVPKDYKKASPVTVIKVSDKQAKGKATITKTCSHDGKALQGAEYDVVAQQEIVSPTAPCAPRPETSSTM